MYPERPYLDAPLEGLSRLYRGISGGLLAGRLLSSGLTAARTSALVEHVFPPSEVLFLEAGEESPPAPFDVPNYTVETGLLGIARTFVIRLRAMTNQVKSMYAATAMSVISDTPSAAKISALERPLSWLSPSSSASWPNPADQLSVSPSSS